MTPRPLAVGEEPPPMYTTDEADRKVSKPSKAKESARTA